MHDNVANKFEYHNIRVILDRNKNECCSIQVGERVEVLLCQRTSEAPSGNVNKPGSNKISIRSFVCNSISAIAGQIVLTFFG